MAEEVGFYYYPTAAVGFATLVTLLQKVLAAKWRAVVITAAEKTAAELDDRLWRLEKFIPHSSKMDDHADRQPIWLASMGDKGVTAAETPNRATVAVFYHSHPRISPQADIGGFAKTLCLIPGDDSALCIGAKALWGELEKGKTTLKAFERRDGGGWQPLAMPL